MCSLLCPKESKQRELTCLLLLPLPDACAARLKKLTLPYPIQTVFLCYANMGSIYSGPYFTDVVAHAHFHRRCLPKISVDPIYFPEDFFLHHFLLFEIRANNHSLWIPLKP
jgi:hypothetical protein